jgi:hypothetical protein
MGIARAGFMARRKALGGARNLYYADRFGENWKNYKKTC